ncbi:MAG: hypothetical protein D6744_16420 [Planctomycetota bacterium]|nr:MAG: hypothetical protein D6744_16420 [Planctomycetota bacterium]
MTDARRHARFDETNPRRHPGEGRMSRQSGGNAMRPESSPISPEQETSLAKVLFNYVWSLLEKDGRTPEDDDEMLHAAHASRFHWGRVGEPVNRARGEWQVSRVYAVLGRPEPARYHAGRCLSLCEHFDLSAFDYAAAHEALARAAAVASDARLCLRHVRRARAWAEKIDDPKDREIIESDLGSIRNHE